MRIRACYICSMHLHRMCLERVVTEKRLTAKVLAVGFVSLFGVAVMSGALQISYINALRQEKPFKLRVAVVEGAATQLRPILMMMMVALIGLIPAARATGIGSDIQRPLATVIVGGLLSALVLTLLVMPVL